MSNQDLTSLEYCALRDGILKGDPTAESEFVHLFASRVQAFCFARIRDRESARDLVQDILFAVILAIRDRRLQAAEQLPAFVYGTARNLVNNYLRNAGRQAPEEWLSPQIMESVAVEVGRTDERIAVLERTLARLRPKEREILILTFSEELKPREIAKKLGISTDVVRARKVRALRRLADRVRKLSRNG